jgi:hypothetical protein
MAHSFGKFCFDKDSLVAKETLKGFMDALLKQSNKDEALIPYHDQLPDEDDGKPIKAPRYFGAGGEFLSECFFEVYGADYNLTGIVSYDDEEIARTDGGVDQEARSRKEKIYSTRLNTKAMPNSPIYIQVKTAVNPTKVFTTNDGSRIMNFFGHAQGLARAQGASYNARYILFTTGKELHWVLKRNTFDMIEVISFKDIKKRVDGDRVFWNRMREKFGLETLDLPPAPMDPEYKSILAEIDAEKCG